MEKVKNAARKVLGTISPKLLASVLNYKAEGHFIDWKNPKSLNEKILWLLYERQGRVDMGML